MARIQIDLPDTFQYSTEMDVLIQHINAANHLANEQLVALLNEARTRFFDSLTVPDHISHPRQFINADLAVIYKAEARHRDRLRFDMAACDFNRYGCDIVYRVSRVQDQDIIAIAKTAMLNFDYQQGRLQAADDQLPGLFAR